MVLDIANDSHLMEDLPWIAESIQLRNIYTDPLNVLQAELLHRSRLAEEEGKEPDPRVEQALMVTIAGVAAGMRNTGYAQYPAALRLPGTSIFPLPDLLLNLCHR